ncbi:N-acetylmuramoyl-L-alanine amidase [Patescibacteria group bacterium]|nr:N-acetylmuramoyl-L-alanine amidase [Patescibacteria group bacterium]MBU1727881.1 N-acetylmuramoyl-L-alanine amidase [Patescibacteria group bacterium]
MKRILFLSLVFIFTLAPFSLACASEPIKILLVPGHDNEIWGAQYGNLKEADMNLRLATDIYNILKKDKRFNVFITRNKNGYTKEFVDYFFTQRDNIVLFKENAKKKTQDEISNGTFIKKDGVQHISASEDTAIKLYGINKWAKEKNMDAVVHIHFNDYPRKTKWTMGKYKGFAIYMPDGHFLNAKESAQLAGNIFAQLSQKYITSTYGKEEGGLISDHELIALGANNTLSEGVRSVLIEYGYIYRFWNDSMRYRSYKTMADLTVRGVKNYFFKK